MSNIDYTAAVTRFLRSVANRLWLVRLVDAARDALWPGAVLLLILAIVHTTFTRIPAMLLLLAIAGILSGVVLRTAVRRPEPVEAAAQADRRFQGRAVMTTAVECLQKAPRAQDAATAMVLAQADQFAQREHGNIRQVIRAAPRSTSTVALIPLFIAVFLLAQPGTEHRVDRGPVQAGLNPVTRPDGQQKNADEISALRRELARSIDPAAEKSSTAEARIRRASDTALATRANGEIVTDANIANMPGGEERTTAGSEDNAGDDAGDALPVARDAKDEPAARLARGDSINVERTGRARATSSTSGLAYSDEADRIPLAGITARPAAPPESARVQTTLTYAQAAYAQRYLDETGDTDD